MRSAVVIFDGDDTLWETEPLYDRARHDSGAILAELGYDLNEFLALQRSIDAEKVHTMGLSVTRFPSSSVQAARELARRVGETIDSATEERIYAASTAVFDDKAPLVPHAREVLSALRDSYRLVLLTKGEVSVQHRRIKDSELVDLFDLARVTDDKTRDTFADVVSLLRAKPAESWSIGNSLPSDVVPALDAGLRAIWIDAHVWIHERRETSVEMTNPRLYVAEQLQDIPAILASAPQPAQ